MKLPSKPLAAMDIYPLVQDWVQLLEFLDALQRLTYVQVMAVSLLVIRTAAVKVCFIQIPICLHIRLRHNHCLANIMSNEVQMSIEIWNMNYASFNLFLLNNLISSLLLRQGVDLLIWLRRLSFEMFFFIWQSNCTRHATLTENWIYRTMFWGF